MNLRNYIYIYIVLRKRLYKYPGSMIMVSPGALKHY